MHQDIDSLAGDELITFIIFSFHKHQAVEGGMKVTNPKIQTPNQYVLASAPCSGGIIVDGGGASPVSAGSSSSSSSSSTATLASHQIAVLAVIREPETVVLTPSQIPHFLHSPLQFLQKDSTPSLPRRDDDTSPA